MYDQNIFFFFNGKKLKNLTKDYQTNKKTPDTQRNLYRTRSYFLISLVDGSSFCGFRKTIAELYSNKKKKTGYFLFSSIWTHPFVRDDTVHSDKSEVVKVKDHYGF